MAVGTPAPAELFKEIDSLEKIKGMAQTQQKSSKGRSNAHIHLPPNFSAFETAAQALDLAQAQKISVVGASNYYDYSVYDIFGSEAKRRGIVPLFGLEVICLIPDLAQKGIKINDPGNPGKMYLCGKGITGGSPKDSKALSLLQTVRDNDSLRMALMTERLAEQFQAAGFQIKLDAQTIIDQIVQRYNCSHDTVYLQERHIAQAFQEALFAHKDGQDRIDLLQRLFGAPSKRPDNAVSVQNEIRSYLLKAGKPAYVPDTFVGFDHAYQLILAMSGIPCYPTLADGASPLTEFEQDVEPLTQQLKSRGIPCAEFIPDRNAPEVLARYVRAMRAAGMFVTAGTEHNTQELTPLEPMCRGGIPLPEDIQEIFWEGACVVAAHQYLTAHGQHGYVSAAGAPKAEYTTDNDRIEEFRRLGEAVIAGFRQQG